MAEPRSDVELAERAGTGDPDAFWSLVEPHDRALRSLAYRLVGDRDRMDDALQDAYLNAFRAFGSFRRGSNLATWLYRIVYNSCLDQLRREGRRRHVALEDVPESSGSEPDPADVAVGRQDVARALESLPPDSRMAVLLVDAEGHDYAEAAAVLQVPVGTVASRLSRARAHLRRALDETSRGEHEEGAEER